MVGKISKKERRTIWTGLGDDKIDTTFGDEGVVTVLSELVDAAGGFQSADIASTSDGGAVLVGNIGLCEAPCKWARESDDKRVGALVRLTEDGEVDPSIGADGVLVFPGLTRLTSIEPPGAAYVVAGTDYGTYLGEDAWLPDESFVARLNAN